MDISAKYCPARRSLEERSWGLVGRLSAMAGRLVGSAAMDHRTFNHLITECGQIRALMTEANSKLKAHRLSHGC